MIRGAVFPHSRSGIVAAILIGLGRAMGETIAVALVIGVVARRSPAQLFGPGDTMAAVIANQFGEATGTYQRRAHRPRRGAVRPHDRRSASSPAASLRRDPSAAEAGA